ncbi:MAG: bifunctional riboflavin kinase/FAD synthetase [Bacteroidetes bacterium]|nr:MAG: bifunctional riboflavin kinase/FAD synthetase [Bacteroidota bacterium]
MRIFQDFEKLEVIQNPVLTIGTFDGVHLGHQKIIDQLNEEARLVGGESVLFTFYPHPRMVLYPESHGLKLLQTQAEKLDKLKRCGLQNVIVYPFTADFSRLTAIEFVRDFLVNKLHVRKLVIGYDHQFGRNREGGIEFLRDVSDTYGFEVIEISAKEIDDVNVSSTKIRNALKSGNVLVANTFLGTPYELTGRVVHGKQLGRDLGFPTANIDLENDLKLIPGNGVYGVKVTLENGSHYSGMMNIGTRPTLLDAVEMKTLEVHLFDFEGDLYDQYLTVQILYRVRNEMRFDDLTALKEQLIKDESTIRDLLSH